MVSIQNEIGTRYKFASCEAIKGQDGSMPVYTRIFLIGVPGVLKHLKTQDARLKAEIGMDFG